MNAQSEFDRCQAFVNCQLRSPCAGSGIIPGVRQWRALTISRQTGCGAKPLADQIAAYLQTHADRDNRPWMVFDQNLVQRVLKDHDLPASMAAFMQEDRISELDDIMEELFGLHPPSWLLVRNTSETILHLATLGNAILIGRAANIITGKLPFVFHVRLIGSMELRVERLRQERRQGRKAALKFIHAEDNARRRYLKKYFGKNADDPMLYHLVINTDLLTPGTAATMIGQVMLSDTTPATTR